MVFDKILAEQTCFKTGRGCWEIRGIYFFDKTECLRFASQHNFQNNIKYHFFDSVYNSLNWDVEPTESLEELYLQRAQQLRDKYDYLILSFSGGSDSTNILNTFLKNNIKLDEIYTFYPVSAIEKLLPQFNINDKHSDNLIFEYALTTLPKLKQISKDHPDIKITIQDFTDRALEFAIGGMINKLFFSGYLTSPTLMGHYYMAERLRSIAEKKTVAAISGLDKPRLIFHPQLKKFGAIFHDFNNLFGNVVLDGFHAPVELFYLTPDLPKITLKQSLEIKKKILSENIFKDVSKMQELASYKNGVFIFDAHHDFFKTIIYKEWDTSTWQAKKTDSFFYQGQGSWFTKSSLTDSRHKQYYDGQVLELVDGIDSRLIEYKDNKPSMLKNFFTSPIWF